MTIITFLCIKKQESMIEKAILEKIAAEVNLKDNDRDFFMRVWNTDPTVYRTKLKALGFENFSHVLDAGCGFGQWTSELASLNKNVTAIEYSEQRVNASRKILEEMEISNCNFIQGSIEEIPVVDNFFDSIFAYSTILCTDYRKTLKEFYRVLKPNGTLYFNTNGLGWYLFNLIDGHNSTESFSSRQMAIDTIKESLKYYINGTHIPGTAVLMSTEIVLKDLREIGYDVIAQGAEGTINLSNNVRNTPFFKGEYYGEEGVFEMIAVKKKI